MVETLHNKAIRIHLLWGYWKPEKTDKAITKTTNDSLGVQAGRGHYDKELFSAAFMQPLRNHTSSTKTYYYKHTLPWEDRVSRLISTQSVEAVSIYLNRQVQRYEEILHEVVGDDAAYTQAVYDQRVHMGSAWNIDDYPSRREFMAKYHGGLDILPLVSSSDIRCTLSDALHRQMIESIERDTQERYKAAMADVWKRLYEPVKRMAEVLVRKEMTFRDTLVTNVVEICDVLPELNILDDPALTVLGEQVKERLAVDPDVLRDSDIEREEYARRASELADILSRMGVS